MEDSGSVAKPVRGFLLKSAPSRPFSVGVMNGDCKLESGGIQDKGTDARPTSYSPPPALPIAQIKPHSPSSSSDESPYAHPRRGSSLLG